MPLVLLQVRGWLLWLLTAAKRVVRLVSAAEWVLIQTQAAAQE